MRVVGAFLVEMSINVVTMVTQFNFFGPYCHQPSITIYLKAIRQITNIGSKATI